MAVGKVNGRGRNYRSKQQALTSVFLASYRWVNYSVKALANRQTLSLSLAMNHLSPSSLLYHQFSDTDATKMPPPGPMAANARDVLQTPSPPPAVAPVIPPTVAPAITPAVAPAIPSAVQAASTTHNDAQSRVTAKRAIFYQAETDATLWSSQGAKQWLACPV